MSDSLRSHGLQPTRLLRPWDFPGKSAGVGCHHLLQLVKESTGQWRRPKRCGFGPLFGKIPWRRKWQPSPVFLLENFMNRGACRLHSVGSHRVGHNWTHTHTHTHTHTSNSSLYLVLYFVKQFHKSYTIPTIKPPTWTERLLMSSFYRWENCLSLSNWLHKIIFQSKPGTVGKNTLKNYTKKILMTQITMMVWSFT